MITTSENLNHIFPIIFDFIRQGVIITNIQGKIIFLSSPLAKILQSSEETLSQCESINQIFPSLNWNIDRLKANNKIDKIVISRDNKIGTTIWLSISIKYYQNYPDEYLIYTVDNITTERKLEAEIKLNQKVYADVANNLPLGIFRLDKYGNVIYINQQTKKLLGKETNIHKPFINVWLDNIYGEDKLLFLEQLSMTLRDKKSSHFTYRYFHPNQHKIIWLETKCIVKKYYNGEEYYLGTIVDITKQKNIENQLIESEKKYRITFESASVGIARISITGKWLKVNKKICEIVGYTAEELNQLTFQDITHPDDLNTDLDLVNDCLTGKINSYSLEKRYIKKNGEIIWIRLNVSLVRNHEKQPQYFISIVQDIDKEKRMEEELRLSEMRFRNAFIYAPFPKMIHAEDGEIISINQAWTDITGYNHQDIPTIETWTEKAYGEKKSKIIQGIDKLYNIKGSLDEGEFIIRTAEGKERVWHFHSAPLGRLPDGRKIVVSMAMDITMRKEIEKSYLLLNKELEKRVAQRTEELQSAQEFLTLIIDNIPQRIFWKDRNSVYLGCNLSFAHVLGYEDTYTIIGKTDFDLPITHHQAQLYREWDRWVMEYNHPRFHIIEKINFKGKEIDTDICRIPLHNHQGEVIGVLITYEDISQKKQLEEKLNLTQFTLDKLPDSVFLLDEKGNFFYANEAASHALGYSQEYLRTMKITDINVTLRDNFISQWQIIMNKLRQDKYLIFESVNIDKQSKLIPIEISLYLFNFDQKIYNCAIVRDISERKKSEEALKESEARYRLMADNVTDMISRHSPDGVYLYVSPSVTSLLGYFPSELLGTYPQNLIYPDDIFKFNFCHHKMIDDNQNITSRYRILHKQGHYIWFETKSKVIKNPQTNEITEIISISRDISNRKEAELKIKKSLQEKEILLKEIHHRVKNNLYIISSLLNLQASYFEDETILKAFQNSQHRIQSMAMIHEKLYQSDNFAELNFADYLTQLVDTLFHSCNPYPQAVKYSISVEPITISIENAVPCGLIVNEIIINGFKHAFHNTHQGKIDIKSYKDKNQYIHLIISDNGEGIAHVSDWQKSRSLGMRLINILTEQLGGNLNINAEKNQGFSYHLVFPEFS